jgi:hypothetical protein
MLHAERAKSIATAKVVTQIQMKILKLPWCQTAADAKAKAGCWKLLQKLNLVDAKASDAEAVAS